MPPESNVESTLIWYKASDEKNVEHWVTALDNFLSGKLRVQKFSIKIQPQGRPTLIHTYSYVIIYNSYNIIVIIHYYYLFRLPFLVETAAIAEQSQNGSIRMVSNIC